jgi:branched-chain amino acid transport system ATP-binding protein
MAVLEVRNLAKHFGGVIALNDVTLEVPNTAIYGVIGPNGAGKTTLFNVISGVDQPHRGQVFLLNQNVTCLSLAQIARKGLGRTFQRSMPFKGMTALENLLVAAYASGDYHWRNIPRRWFGLGRADGEIVARAHDLLRLVGLAGRGEKMSETLSHGDVRRLEVARALMIKPRVLLLDEPAAGLSSEELAQIAAILLSVRADGTTIVIIEHNMTLMMRICDRIAVLDHGVKIAEGTPAEIQRNATVLEAYFGKERRGA